MNMPSRRHRLDEQAQASRAALERLARCSNELASELVALYGATRARGIALDLGAVQAVSARVAARLFAARDTLLLVYDPVEQRLRARRPPAIEIELPIDEARRVVAVGQAGPLAERLRRALDAEDLLVTPFGHTAESFGLIAVRGAAGQPFSGTEADLLRHFGDFLAATLTGARLYKEVLELSAIDGLTGLYNHRFFQDRLRDEVARAARYRHPVSLLFCDIDDFKAYNDRNGHVAGDEVLATLGRLFRSSGVSDEVLVAFRESDVRARYGGEEFTVLLPETTHDHAAAKAERLRAAVEQTRFPRAEGQPLGRLTMSIGISELPRHAGDECRLVEIADDAMYRAKQLGKNRVVSPA
jgi:diguanylate cyclase (GGDEF)-like protein